MQQILKLLYQHQNNTEIGIYQVMPLWVLFHLHLDQDESHMMRLIKDLVGYPTKHFLIHSVHLYVSYVDRSEKGDGGLLLEILSLLVISSL